MDNLGPSRQLVFHKLTVVDSLAGVLVHHLEPGGLEVLFVPGDVAAAVETCHCLRGTRLSKSRDFFLLQDVKFLLVCRGGSLGGSGGGLGGGTGNGSGKFQSESRGGEPLVEEFVTKGFALQSQVIRLVAVRCGWEEPCPGLLLCATGVEQSGGSG